MKLDVTTQEYEPKEILDKIPFDDILKYCKKYSSIDDLLEDKYDEDIFTYLEENVSTEFILDRLTSTAIAQYCKLNNIYPIQSSQSNEFLVYHERQLTELFNNVITNSMHMLSKDDVEEIENFLRTKNFL